MKQERVNGLDLFAISCPRTNILISLCADDPVVDIHAVDPRKLVNRIQPRDSEDYNITAGNMFRSEAHVPVAHGWTELETYEKLAGAFSGLNSTQGPAPHTEAEGAPTADSSTLIGTRSCMPNIRHVSSVFSCLQRKRER